MKLRISGNSLRLRLLQSDVAKLASDGRLEEMIHFDAAGQSKLTYALEQRANVSAASVAFTGDEMLLVLPSASVDAWTTSDEVGIYETLDLGPAGSLSISVEKDFACLDIADGDNADTFPNPKVGVAC